MLVDHCDKIGKKILVTGNGKCNLTNRKQTPDCYRGEMREKAAAVLSAFGLKDAMELLSQIMAGINDGILKTDEPCSLFGLMVGIQPANLLSRSEKPLSREELDAARAAFLRERLPEIQ